MLVLKNAAHVTLLAFVITTEVMAAPSTNETLPGKPLTDLGLFLNKPHLVLSGKIINNLARKLSDDLESRIGKIDKDLKSQIGNVDEDLESRIDKVEKDLRSEMTDVAKEICRLHPCTEWGKWNHCKYTFLKGFGYFGRQNRTRNCGFNTTLCKRFSTDQNIEVEFRSCNTCSGAYEVTEHGYCIQLVPTVSSQSTAAKSCQILGGNLVNIDSEIKFQDVSTYLKKRNLNYVVWIDGRRATENSKWEFSTQPKDHSFRHWYLGKPTNGFCLQLMYTGTGSSRNFYINDYGCNNKLFFLCEVIS